MPQFLLNAGFNKIACTQPRRLSAMALCRRVAFETMNAYGSQVAYQIRFDSTRTGSTRILFLTEGVLLRQLSGDPLLTQYDVIIVDEVRGCPEAPALCPVGCRGGGLVVVVVVVVVCVCVCVRERGVLSCVNVWWWTWGMDAG